MTEEPTNQAQENLFRPRGCGDVGGRDDERTHEERHGKGICVGGKVVGLLILDRDASDELDQD